MAVKFIKFGATWCGPCQKYDPILDKVIPGLGDQVQFTSVDVDEDPDLARKYGVKGVPFNVFLNPADDSVLGVHQGALTPKQIKSVVSDFNEQLA